MDSQLYGELLALALVITGSIGAIVKALTDRLVRDLAANTKLTKETREALQSTVDRLAAARNSILGLREIIRERDDRIAYLIARHPEAERTLYQYQDRRARRATAADEREAERHIIAAIDDPTGTDAGAHPDG